MLNDILGLEELEREELATQTVSRIMDSLEPRDRVMLAMYFGYAMPEDYNHGEPVTPETIGKYIGEKFRRTGRALSGKAVRNRIYLITGRLRGDRDIVKAVARVLKSAA